jgi:hypothetical protein
MAKKRIKDDMFNEGSANVGAENVTAILKKLTLDNQRENLGKDGEKVQVALSNKSRS